MFGLSHGHAETYTASWGYDFAIMYCHMQRVDIGKMLRFDRVYYIYSFPDSGPFFAVQEARDWLEGFMEPGQPVPDILPPDVPVPAEDDPAQQMQKKPFDLLGLLLDPRMMNVYLMGLLIVAAKTAKSPEAQKRLESFIRTMADAVGKAGPFIPYAVAGGFGYTAGIPGIPQKNLTVNQRVTGAGIATVALELGKSGNLAAGAAGLGYLATIGVISMAPYLDILGKQAIHAAEGVVTPIEEWADGIASAIEDFFGNLFGL